MTDYAATRIATRTTILKRPSMCWMTWNYAKEKRKALIVLKLDAVADLHSEV